MPVDRLGVIYTGCAAPENRGLQRLDGSFEGHHRVPKRRKWAQTSLVRATGLA